MNKVQQVVSDVNVNLTVLTSRSPLTKQYHRDPDDPDKVVGRGQTQLYDGKARVVSVHGLDGLGRLLSELESNQAVTLGVPRPELIRGGGGEAIVKTKDEALALRRAGGDVPVVARCKRDWTWPDGPGLLLLDVDACTRPAVGLTERIEPERLVQVLGEAVPALRGVQWLYRPSASARVAGTGKQGYHLYAVVDRAEAVGDVLKVIWSRLALAGHGRVEVGGAGQLLRRAVVDAAVGTPWGLVYEGRPIAGDGVRVLSGGCQLLGGGGGGGGAGGVIDSAAVLAHELSEDELDRLAGLWADLEGRDDLGRMVADAQAAWKDARRTELIKAGVRQESIERVLDRRAEGLLDDDDVVFSKDGPVRVAVLLNDSRRYHKTQLADPMEPEYGAGGAGNAGGVGIGKAVFLNGDGQEPIIFSHAHGGRVYRFARYHKAKVSRALERLRQVEDSGRGRRSGEDGDDPLFLLRSRLHRFPWLRKVDEPEGGGDVDLALSFLAGGRIDGSDGGDGGDAWGAKVTLSRIVKALLLARFRIRDVARALSSDGGELVRRAWPMLGAGGRDGVGDGDGAGDGDGGAPCDVAARVLMGEVLRLGREGMTGGRGMLTWLLYRAAVLSEGEKGDKVVMLQEWPDSGSVKLKGDFKDEFKGKISWPGVGDGNTKVRTQTIAEAWLQYGDLRVRLDGRDYRPDRWRDGKVFVEHGRLGANLFRLPPDVYGDDGRGVVGPDVDVSVGGGEVVDERWWLRTPAAPLVRLMDWWGESCGVDEQGVPVIDHLRALAAATVMPEFMPRRSTVTPLCISGFGVGKSTFARVLEAIVTGCGMRECDMNADTTDLKGMLKEKHDDTFFRCVYVYVDETSTSESKYDLSEMLRTRLTDVSGKVNRKYDLLTKERVYCNVWLMTNRVDALALDWGDRRVMCVDLRWIRKEDLGEGGRLDGVIGDLMEMVSGEVSRGLDRARWCYAWLRWWAREVYCGGDAGFGRLWRLVTSTAPMTPLKSEVMLETGGEVSEKADVVWQDWCRDHGVEVFSRDQFLKILMKAGYDEVMLGNGFGPGSSGRRLLKHECDRVRWDGVSRCRVREIGSGSGGSGNKISLYTYRGGRGMLKDGHEARELYRKTEEILSGRVTVCQQTVDEWDLI